MQEWNSVIDFIQIAYSDIIRHKIVGFVAAVRVPVFLCKVSFILPKSTNLPVRTVCPI